MRSVVVAAVALGVLAASALGASSSGGADSTALLARYAPVLKLYASDRKPSAIEPFLAGADLERLSSGGAWRVVRKSPPASALANGSKQLRLNTRGCSPATNPPTCYRVQATTPTVYGRVWKGIGTFANTTVLQYWLFYPLNDWRNSQTKPTVWYLHEGDWEEVSVQLSPAGKPIAVALSQPHLRQPLQAMRLATDGPQLVVQSLRLVELGCGPRQVPRQQARLPDHRARERDRAAGVDALRGPPQVLGDGDDLGVRRRPVQEELRGAQVAVEDRVGDLGIGAQPPQLVADAAEPVA